MDRRALTRFSALAATALVLGIAGFVLSATAGVTPDLSGPWRLQADGLLPVGEGGQACDFQGSAQVSQDGSALGGDANLTLVSGPAECPAELTAQLTGTVTGGSIEMGVLMGGQQGTAQFTGTMGQDEDSFAGPYQVDTGPFVGTTGQWLAIRGTVSNIAIPTLTAAGLAVLVLLLLGGGMIVLRRQRQNPA